MHRLLACVLAVTSIAPIAGAAPPAVESHVRTVSLFKNGLAFVTREAKLPAAAKVRLDDLPVPVHGTFWAWTPGRADGLRRMTARREPRRGSRAVASVAELLRANAGRDAEVVFHDGRTAQGRIVAPSDDAVAPLLLATSDGTIAFDAAAIDHARVLGAPPSTAIARDEPGATLDLELASRDAGRLDLVYAARGATWAPSYTVELLGRDRARLTAKAEIVNELEDLNDVELDLVTGYPNVRWSEVDDPVAMRGDLAAFLNALGTARGVPVDAFTNVTRQTMRGWEEADVRPAISPRYPLAIPAGERVDELFLYPVSGFSLARGERAYVPLFTIECAAEHRYEIELDDRVHDDRFDDARRYDGSRPARPEDIAVWHRIRLDNAGHVPWTTGPAMVTRDGALVAQDLLAYAAPGGGTTIDITRVGDVLADANEFEVARKPNALRLGGTSYDEVTVRGVVRVASLRGDEVTLSITKRLTGEVTASTPEATAEKSARRLTAANPNTTLRWRVPVPARGSATLEYHYTVYVYS